MARSSLYWSLLIRRSSRPTSRQQKNFNRRKQAMDNTLIVNNILIRFDFERVHAVMRATGWCWGKGRNSHIPSVEELQMTARSILYRAIHSRCQITKGGFVATVRDPSVFRGELVSLSFEIARTSAH